MDASLERLRLVGSATLATQLFKRGLRRMHMSGVRALTRRPRVVGHALTLRYIPAREDLDVLEAFRDPSHPQRKAIESAGRHDVIVIDARARDDAASAGHILVTRLMRRGAAGLVTDGGLRDIRLIAEMDFPVFAAGGTPALNLTAHHAVDINVPIACGGVAVFPTDVVVGDEDGVVVIPRHLVAEVTEEAIEQERLEDFLLGKVEAGAALPGTYPPDDATLREYAEREAQPRDDSAG